MASEKIKLTGFQKKLFDTLKDSEKLAEKLKNKQPFDHPCTNEFCSGKDEYGNNPIGTAWQSKKGGYCVFCISCGEMTSFTKEEFKKTPTVKSLKEDKKQKRNNKTKYSSVKSKWLSEDDIEIYELQAEVA